MFEMTAVVKGPRCLDKNIHLLYNILVLCQDSALNA